MELNNGRVHLQKQIPLAFFIFLNHVYSTEYESNCDFFIRFRSGVQVLQINSSILLQNYRRLIVPLGYFSFPIQGVLLLLFALQIQAPTNLQQLIVCFCKVCAICRAVFRHTKETIPRTVQVRCGVVTPCV